MSLEEIQRAIGLLFQPGQLVEVRAKFRNGQMASLYFTDLARMARALAKNDANDEFQALWYTLQKLKPGINLTKDPGKATVRDDVACYEWLVIDIDRAKQPKGTKKQNATDAEMRVLEECRDKVQAWLASLGWPNAIIFCSGNGYHLLYKLSSMPVSDFLVLKDTLKGIAYHFRDISGWASEGKLFNIDESLSEPEQIVKCYGTMTRLSDKDGGDRPWRRSGIVYAPDTIKPLDLGDLLLAQAEMPGEFSGSKYSSSKKGRPYDPVWYENYGVAHLFEWAHPYLVYESDEYTDSKGEIHHPSSNCVLHGGEDGIYQHPWRWLR